MATNPSTNAKTAEPKAKKPPVPLGDRVKNQLTQAALRNKLSVDELSDIEQHIKKLASILV